MKAMERRENEFERRRENVKAHLDRVRIRRDRLRMVRRIQPWWRKLVLLKRHSLAFLKTHPDENLRLIYKPYLLRNGVGNPIRLTEPGTMPPNSQEEVSFEALARHISSKPVIRAAGAFLESIKPPNRKSKSGIQAVTVRSFLASLMIVYHPNTVLGIENSDSSKPIFLCRRVESSAWKLAKFCENILETVVLVKSKPSYALHGALVSRMRLLSYAHSVYSHSFASWKHADILCVADELQNTYVAIHRNLYEVQKLAENVTGDSSVVSHYDPGLQQHLSGIMEQLETIKERANKLMGKEKFESWIKTADAAVSEDKKKLNTKHSLEVDEKTNSKVDNSKKPTTDSSIANPKANVDAVLSSFHKRSNSLRHMTNEAIIHELMLDPSFKLADPQYTSANTALLKAFSRELKEGRFQSLIHMIDSIRVQLAKLTPHRLDLIDQLNERLDVDLLLQMMEAGNFDVMSLYSLMQFIGERLLALQAPARQADCEAWLLELYESANSKGACWSDIAPRCMERALQELALINLDMKNFQLHQLAAYIHGDDGIAYLRNRFNSRFQASNYKCNPSVMPEKSVQWLRKAFDSVTKRREELMLQAHAAMPDSTMDSTAVTPPTLNDCIVEGWLDLLFDSSVVSQEDMKSRILPESLSEFDTQRMFEFNRALSTFSFLAVLHIIVSQVLRGHEKVEFESFLEARDRLFGLSQNFVENNDRNNSASVKSMCSDLLALVDHVLMMKNSDGLSEKSRMMIETMVLQWSSSPLAKTVSRQFNGIIRKALRFPSRSYDQLLKKISLNPWKSQVIELCHNIMLLFELNRKVSEPMYQSIFAHIKLGASK